jgi:hypothetical protein
MQQQQPKNDKRLIGFLKKVVLNSRFRMQIYCLASLKMDVIFCVLYHAFIRNNCVGSGGARVKVTYYW